jgi:catechol 2,3-dioxygenase-like lactoylglutathione lyase family enzyme
LLAWRRGRANNGLDHLGGANMTKLVEGLAVVLLLARDTERTSAFYRDVLELPLREEVHDGKHKHYACQLGGLYFTIQSAVDLAAPAPGRGYDFLQLCFTVADLDAFVRRLEELKVSPLHGPRPFEHTTYTTLLDPDGRHVRVMTPWQR